MQQKFWSEEHRANHSVQPACGEDLKTREETSRSSSCRSRQQSGRGGFCGRTCRVFCERTEDGTLVPSSGRWLNSGMGSPTEFWTLATSECPSVAEESFLSDVLETGMHLSRYFLTTKAGGGIARRLAKKSISIPEVSKAIGLVGLLDSGGTDEE